MDFPCMHFSRQRLPGRLRRIERACCGSKVAIWLTCFLTFFGCNSKDDDPPEGSSALHAVGNTGPSDQAIDIVFIHGVDGNYQSTWHPTGKESDYWPKWIATDHDYAGVWSIDYPAATTVWRGHTMPLIDRARDLLGVLEADGFHKSDKPLVFVTHSFGGLVAKQMIKTGSESPNDAWKAIANRTKGVVFIATPNAGSNLATYLEFLAGKLTTVTVDELAFSEPRLLELNRWYIRQAPLRGIETLAFCETQPTSGIMVVPEATADPHIANSEIHPGDGNHATICKLQSRDAKVYKLVSQFLERMKLPDPPITRPNPADVGDPEHRSSFPTREQVVNQHVSIDRSKFALVVTNQTREPVMLSLYDCTRHYAEPKRRDLWRDFPAPTDGVPKVYENHFDNESTGWFCLYVSNDAGFFSKCLAVTNLFAETQAHVKITGQSPDYRIELE